MPSYAFPSISLGQQIDNLQIQIETRVSLLWVEPNYRFMSSHLYSDLREIPLSITQQPHVNSFRITWVEKLKNTAPYRTLGYMTSLYDIVVCYLSSLIWPMSMKALAKKQRRHDNLHREMDSHVTTSKFQTVFRLFGWSLWQHHPSKSEKPGMERHSLSWPLAVL